MKFDKIYIAKAHHSINLFLYYDENLYVNQSKKLVCYCDNFLLKTENNTSKFQYLYDLISSVYGKYWYTNGKVFNL